MNSPSLTTTFTLWDVASRKRLRDVRARNSPEAGIFSAEGKLLLWRAHSKGPARTLSLPRSVKNSGAIGARAFSPDGKTVVAAFKNPVFRSNGQGHEAYVWDVTTGKLQHALTESDPWMGATEAIIFSPDSSRLATAIEGYAQIKLWDVKTGRLVTRLDLGDGATAVAFSHDGTMIAGASGDSFATPQIYVWRAGSERSSTWERFRVLEGHHGTITALAFSPDGNTLASGTDKGTVRVQRIK